MKCSHYVNETILYGKIDEKTELIQKRSNQRRRKWDRVNLQIKTERQAAHEHVLYSLAEQFNTSGARDIMKELKDFHLDKVKKF